MKGIRARIGCVTDERKETSLIWCKQDGDKPFSSFSADHACTKITQTFRFAGEIFSYARMNASTDLHQISFVVVNSRLIDT